MVNVSDFALSPGSLILVSGANGFIASHVVDQLLQLGFNVRGTVRVEKPWLDRYFQDKYGTSRYHSIIVPAIEEDDAFDKAVKDVAGFVHVASDMSFDPRPDVMIPRTVKGTINALVAARNQNTVRRFVLTSSSTAATNGNSNVPGIRVDEQTWNLASIEAAWNTDIPSERKGGIVYSASKTEQERTAWQWLKDKKPAFVLNTTLPNVNIGPILTPEIAGSTMSLVHNLLKGDPTAINVVGHKYFVDVRDTARLHVLALLDSSVQSERIFAFAHAPSWNDIISILRTLRPENQHLLQLPKDEGRNLLEIVRRDRAVSLLRSFFNQPDWTPLEETLAAGIEGL